LETIGGNKAKDCKREINETQLDYEVTNKLVESQVKYRKIPNSSKELKDSGFGFKIGCGEAKNQGCDASFVVKNSSKAHRIIH